MKIAFRTDASLQIGSGHVMRCLTLADALTAQGAQCHFICREHPGHLLNLIRQRGYKANSLPALVQHALIAIKVDTSKDTTQALPLAHAAWLGCDWETDAAQTSDILVKLQPDWLIADHYALDHRWEDALKPHYRQLMVIDDLADRTHHCNVLLDQNLVHAMMVRYQGKVPVDCTNWLGPQYALVRPEFSALRSNCLARRKTPVLHRLLVFMGGSDTTNETSKVLAGIRLSQKKWQHIDVVVGQGYPFLDALKASLAALPTTTLHVQTPDMAKLMAAADLAITTGGSVTWEKCTLGLPSIVSIDGDNQRPIARMMHECGAQRTLGLARNLTPAAYADSLDNIQTNELTAMIDSASAVCDGSGIQSIVQTIVAPS